MPSETIVYHDKNYVGVWIDPNFSTSISAFFQTNGIRTIDAVGLREFIKESIDKHDSHQKIIVFSQDMVPDTVCEKDKHPLIREYLDAGGNVVWIGDVPFFYVGVKNAPTPKQCIQAWFYGAPVYVGSTIFVSCSTMRSVDLKMLGKVLGLSHHWTSARPILKDETITALATTKNIGSDYSINVPKAPSKVDKILGKLRIKRVDVGSLGVDIASSQDLEPLVRMYPLKPDIRHERRKNTLFETHVSAWIKNYNKDLPYCGFARIWDYGPVTFPDWMLKELHDFSVNFAKRIE